MQHQQGELASKYKSEMEEIVMGNIDVSTGLLLCNKYVERAEDCAGNWGGLSGWTSSSTTNLVVVSFEQTCWENLEGAWGFVFFPDNVRETQSRPS